MSSDRLLASLLSFVDANSVALAGMLSGYLVGGVFAVWPAFSARLYAPLFPISPVTMRRLGYVGLAWGAWSTVALVVRIYFGVDLMPWDDIGF